jgi:hypothetical protein
MIFVTIYALASAIGFVVDLAHHQWIAMLCVGLYSAAAYRGGDDLYHVLTDKTFNQKFGRAVIALLLIAFAFYIANYPMHLVYATVSGHLWVILGVLCGLVSSADFTRRA